MVLLSVDAGNVVPATAIAVGGAAADKECDTAAVLEYDCVCRRPSAFRHNRRATSITLLLRLMLTSAARGCTQKQLYLTMNLITQRI